MSVVPAPNLLIIRYGNLLTNYRSFQTFNFNINGQLFSLSFFFFFFFFSSCFPTCRCSIFIEKNNHQGGKLSGGGEKGQLLLKCFERKNDREFLENFKFIHSIDERLSPFFLFPDSLSFVPRFPFLNFFFFNLLK